MTDTQLARLGMTDNRVPGEEVIAMQHPIICALLAWNWLRVSDTAERSQVNQRICHQLHTKMSLLKILKPQEESLKFVLPLKGPLDMSS